MDALVSRDRREFDYDIFGAAHNRFSQNCRFLHGWRGFALLGTGCGGGGERVVCGSVLAVPLFPIQKECVFEGVEGQRGGGVRA